jgi:hypothetical protein
MPDFVSWIKIKAAKHKLKNGILPQRGDLTEELAAFQATEYNLADFLKMNF